MTTIYSDGADTGRCRHQPGDAGTPGGWKRQEGASSGASQGLDHPTSACGSRPPNPAGMLLTRGWAHAAPSPESSMAPYCPRAAAHLRSASHSRVRSHPSLLPELVSATCPSPLPSSVNVTDASSLPRGDERVRPSTVPAAQGPGRKVEGAGAGGAASQAGRTRSSLLLCKMSLGPETGLS